MFVQDGRDKLRLVVGVEGLDGTPVAFPLNLHAAEEGAVEGWHEVVGGPLLIEVAADDDGAAERDDEAQQRQRRVAFHAGDDAECLLHSSC